MTAADYTIPRTVVSSGLSVEMLAAASSMNSFSFACYTAEMDPLSIYLHIPFCQQRCGYCDFNTYAGLGKLIPAYVDALASEVQFYGDLHQAQGSAPVHTIYFGGGTPSLLSAINLAT